MAAGIFNPYGGATKKQAQGQDTSMPLPKREGSASDPYRGGLMTNFDWLKNVNTMGVGGYNYDQANRMLAQAGQNDRDVSGAAAAYNERLHPLAGTNSAEQAALYDMYMGRINQRNSLAEQIQNTEGEGKNAAIHDIYGEATRALGQGLKKTRENYNSRGLLYSGLREGGEGAMRAAVGSKLSSDIAGTNREMANSAEKAKQAYAAVGLQNQKEMIDLANQAYDTVSRNAVARAQAYQQFAGGLGGLAALGYDKYHSSGGAATPQSNVNASYSPDQGGVGGRQGLLAGVGD